MTQRCEMNANLMCSSGAGRNLKQSKARKPAQHVISGESLTCAKAAGFHALAAGGIAADGSVHHTIVALHAALNESNVSFANGACLEVRSQLAMRGVILGHQNQARSHLI